MENDVINLTFLEVDLKWIQREDSHGKDSEQKPDQ
jgi:hypothetical protein